MVSGRTRRRNMAARRPSRDFDKHFPRLQQSKLQMGVTEFSTMFESAHSFVGINVCQTLYTVGYRNEVAGRHRTKALPDGRSSASSYGRSVRPRSQAGGPRGPFLDAACRECDGGSSPRRGSVASAPSVGQAIP